MGFETVVRPVVFPNIRPAPAQPQSPAEDPTQGLATIHGASGQFLDLQYSWSASGSTSNPRELRRRVDEVRIYQQNDDGTVNRDNFVDVEVANKIWMKDAENTIPNVYSPVEETDNIQIKKRDVIRINRTDRIRKP